jgi:PAS domain S-box-containing protein
MGKGYLTVLIVEDDEDDFISLKSLFSQISPTKFRLEWTDTYEAGLEGICRAEHDVCLLDYRLGARSGLELLREAAQRGCVMPIILLSGQGGYDIDVKAMEAGASDYLVKGQITADLLERSIRYSILQKHTDIELRRYRDHLEEVILERTLELQQANIKLKSEIDVRRKAEEASRQLAAIVESSDDAIISETLDGVITSWNKAAEILYGYSAADAIGQQSIALHIPPDRTDEIPDLLERIGHGERIFHHEATYRSKYGHDISVLLTISPIKDNAGTIIGTSTIARDISERERVRKERENLIAELQEALVKVKALKGLLPICAWCKKIRNDQGYWQQIEAYIRDHSEADFSHGICPECAQKIRAETQ